MIKNKGYTHPEALVLHGLAFPTRVGFVAPPNV